MEKTLYVKLSAILFASFALLACGGGGNNENTAPQKVKVQRLVSEIGGSPYKLVSHFYDEMGRLIRSDVDINGDGVLDDGFSYIYNYDDRGELLSRVYDIGSGIIVTETYNSSGDIITTTVVRQGVPDPTSTNTFTYDDKLLVINFQLKILIINLVI